MVRFRYWIPIVFAVLLLRTIITKAQGKQPKYEVDVQTDLVRLYVMVFDKDGRVATGLTANDFEVLDDGQPQRIAKFSGDLRQPVSIVLDADVSQSMQHKLSFVREAAYDAFAPFPNAAEQAKFSDEFSLVRFATRADVASDFEPPQTLQSETNFLIQPTDGRTSLFDSIYLSINEIQQEAANKRRAIILVTDGGDNHSRYTLNETRRFLEEEDIPIFPIMATPSMELLDLFSNRPAAQNRRVPIQLPYGLGLDQKDVIGPAERRGPHNLKVLAEQTGGEIFKADHLSDLPDITQSIAVALRYSYLVGYNRPERDAPHSRGWNGWHRVSVRLVPPGKYLGFLVIAKSGYFEGYR